MRKRINRELLLLNACLIGVGLHSLYLLINGELKAFFMCGVFACYLLLAVAKQSERESDKA